MRTVSYVRRQQPTHASNSQSTNACDYKHRVNIFGELFIFYLKPTNQSLIQSVNTFGGVSRGEWHAAVQTPESGRKNPSSRHVGVGPEQILIVRGGDFPPWPKGSPRISGSGDSY